MIAQNEGNDSGSASLEFILVTVALIVPVLLGLVVLDRVQSALFATQTVATQVLRVYTHHPVTDLVEIEDALELVLDAHGLQDFTQQPNITVNCQPECFMPGASVQVGVELQVQVLDLPFIGEKLTSVTLRKNVEGVRLQYVEAAP